MAAFDKHKLIGNGRLVFSGGACDVAYDFVGDVKRSAGKGSLTASPDEMRAAFRAGRANLTFDDGRDAVITVVAHSEGAPNAYFEMTGARRT